MRARGMDQAEAERQNIQSRLNHMCLNPILRRLRRRIALVLARDRARLGQPIQFQQHEIVLLATALLAWVESR